MKITTITEKPTKPTTSAPKSGVKVEASVEASGPVLQHNETLVRR